MTLRFTDPSHRGGALKGGPSRGRLWTQRAEGPRRPPGRTTHGTECARQAQLLLCSRLGGAGRTARPRGQQLFRTKAILRSTRGPSLGEGRWRRGVQRALSSHREQPALGGDPVRVPARRPVLGIRPGHWCVGQRTRSTRRASQGPRRAAASGAPGFGARAGLQAGSGREGLGVGADSLPLRAARGSLGAAGFGAQP